MSVNFAMASSRFMVLNTMSFIDTTSYEGVAAESSPNSSNSSNSSKSVRGIHRRNVHRTEANTESEIFDTHVLSKNPVAMEAIQVFAVNLDKLSPKVYRGALEEYPQSGSCPMILSHFFGFWRKCRKSPKVYRGALEEYP